MARRSMRRRAKFVHLDRRRHGDCLSIFLHGVLHASKDAYPREIRDCHQNAQCRRTRYIVHDANDDTTKLSWTPIADGSAMKRLATLFKQLYRELSRNGFTSSFGSVTIRSHVVHLLRHGGEKVREVERDSLRRCAPRTDGRCEIRRPVTSHVT